jgi:DNA repair exonuclease SbcCD nuclease subunit
MKFVHMADIHFDTPFTVLGQRMNLAEKRRLEQRNVFSKIIEHIKYENIPYLFISGDLYDQQHVRNPPLSL